MIIHLVALVFGFLAGIWYAQKNTGDVEGLLKKMKIQVDELDKLKSTANEVIEEAEKMKIEFLEKIHRKIDICVTLKDDEGKTIEKINI